MSQAGTRRGWAGLAVLGVAAVAISGILWLMLNGAGGPPADPGVATAAIAGEASDPGGSAQAVAPPSGEAGSLTTGSGGGGRVTLRGWPGQWLAVDLPLDWSAQPGGADELALVHYPVAGQVTSYVKVDLRRGVGLSGEPADDWPTGTTTHTLQVAGRPALRYVLPPETSALDGKVACQVSVAVLPPGGAPATGASAAGGEDLELGIVTHVAGVDTAADCAPGLAAAEGLVQSIQLLPDETAALVWTESAVTMPGLPGIQRYVVAHPVGWSLREQADRLVLEGSLGDPSIGGALQIEALPGQPEAYFESAQDLLGAPLWLRWVGSRVTAGRRTTEYAKNDVAPSRWLVTGPDVAEDSPEGRVIDQAVWRILLNSTFTYDGAQGYP